MVCVVGEVAVVGLPTLAGLAELTGVLTTVLLTGAPIVPVALVYACTVGALVYACVVGAAFAVTANGCWTLVADVTLCDCATTAPPADPEGAGAGAGAGAGTL